jgi:hypothetical protein
MFRLDTGFFGVISQSLLVELVELAFIEDRGNGVCFLLTSVSI